MLDGAVVDVVFHTGPGGVPDGASVLRVVDEGVAVVLVVSENDVVAVDFLLADGVLVAPAEEHVDGPGLDYRLVGHSAGAPVGVFVEVAHAHIHDGAGEIAFILVDRLEHGAGIAQRRLASA